METGRGTPTRLPRKKGGVCFRTTLCRVNFLCEWPVWTNASTMPVQMGKWCVHEVRVVHVGMHGHLCRPVSAASEEVDGADAARRLSQAPIRSHEFSMFANGSLLQLVAVLMGIKGYCRNFFPDGVAMSAKSLDAPAVAAV